MLTKMKVEIPREVNVEEVLLELSIKARPERIKGALTYEESVSKQLLQDAHDIICELRTTIELLNKELEDHDRL